MTNLVRVIWAGERGEPKPLRLSAVDDLPDVEGHVPFDLLAIGVEEAIPVLLEDLFECEWGFGDSFHDGQGL